MDPLLSNNNIFTPVKRLYVESVERGKRWEEDLFQRWVGDVSLSIEENELYLHALSKPLIYINPQSGMIETCYNKKHADLLFQARQLAEMEFEIPASLLTYLQKIENIHFFGVRLHKIASFYNDFEISVLPEQREILFDLLIFFEDKLKRTKLTVSSLLLDGASECQKFLESLQSAVEILKEENSKLRKSHVSLSNLAASLLDTNLVLKRSEWQSKWHDLRKNFAAAIKPFPVQRTVRYAEYWDFQICKILEIGYIWGIENIHHFIGEIKCELIHSDRGIQLSPSIHSVRSKYYSKMTYVSVFFYVIPQK